MAANQRVDVGDGSNSTVRLHLWDGSLPLDSFRAVRVPATEAVGQKRRWPWYIAQDRLADKKNERCGIELPRLRNCLVSLPVPE